MALRAGLFGLIGPGAALMLGGCAGAGNGTQTLGPNPPTSVSPVSTSPGAGSQSAAKAAFSHSLAAVQTWAAPAVVPDTKPAATLAALAAHTESLLILDPAAVTASLPTALPAPISAQKLKSKPLDALRQNGARRLLAILDIADMTKTSPLWQASWVDVQGKLTPNAPTWLRPADPKTPDTYPIQYWDGAWQKLMQKSLDMLVADGYDGVSVRGVGTFSRFQKDHAPAATEMAAFVGDLAVYARKTNPDFCVLADGGTALPAALPDVPRKDYLEAIDGVLARDVFYPGDKPMDNDLAPDADVLAALDAFQKAGKPVFVTERLTDPDKIADFLARARSKGYLPDAAFTPQTLAAPVADPKIAANRL